MLVARTVLAVLLLAVCAGVSGQVKIDRVEPPCWWSGMRTPLQLMFYGEGVGKAKVSVKEKCLSVSAVHRAESPNYLFVDVVVDENTPAGDYTFVFTTGKKTATHKYTIYSRREGSAERESFGPADAIYLLMPDRFANGDPSNDSVEGAAEKQARDEYFGRHGGDIKGIMDNLGYISDLWMTALWSTPLLFDNEPRQSYHGYACADYYMVDPRYGTNDDYREMVRLAHGKGLKVIKDVVTNHCRTAHWWMNDLPYADWIHQHDKFTKSNGTLSVVSDPNASDHDLKQCVEAWFDNSMPDMALENPMVLHYFRQVFVWWIEWADLDGLRVDTYPYNDKEGISKWTKYILEEYPNLNIVGECWTGSPAMVAYWEEGAHNHDGYDSHLPSVMDFPLMDAIAKGLGGSRGRFGEGLSAVYNSLAHDFVYREPRNLMTFLDNHDTERFADAVDGDPAKIKMGLTLLATMRGMPQLYYGTELMLRSADRAHGHGSARVGFPGGWAGDEVDYFDERQRTGDVGEVYSHAARLFNWRKQTPVIHSGKTTHFLSRSNTYVFFRHDDRGKVMVVANVGDKPFVPDWDLYQELLVPGETGKDVLRGTAVTAGDELTVDPMSCMVIDFSRD